MLRTIIRLFLVVLLPLVTAIAVFNFMKGAFLDPADATASSPVLVEIEPGKNFRQICKDLHTKGLLRYWWSLDALARIQGNDTTINAGEYELSAAMPPRDILQKLSKGEIYLRKITVREGMSIWEIGKLVEDAGLLSEADFNRALVEEELLAMANLPATSFEGYLFPETYHFSKPVTAKRIIWAMMEESDKHWPQEFTERADQLKLSRHEVLTLASIIEKESGNVTEQPIISSVFHNRLQQGMRLQSDPTVIYGIPHFNGNITKADLEEPTPYNTYVIFGLPPGPIANPGETAIRAALNPAETQYLYFVADGRGNHVFSTTLKDHNEAVRKFQLKK